MAERRTLAGVTWRDQLVTKDRKSSVLYFAVNWSAKLVDSIQPPRHSSRFLVTYATRATNSHRASSEWLKYPEFTPRQWIEATFPDYSRILSIVFDKA